MQKRYLTSTVLAVAVFLMSCNLSDFSTDKLTPLNQVSPVLYLPIAYGTFKFSDYAKIAETGNAVVNTAQIDFKPNPIPYDIQELNFSSTKLDSLYIIVKSQNETPMKYRYQFSFSGETFDSGLLKSALLTPSNDVLEAGLDSIEFKLTHDQILKLGASPSIDFAISLFQPDKGKVIASVLKSSQLSIKIALRAPVNLAKQ